MALGDLTHGAAIACDVEERHPLDLKLCLARAQALDLLADEGERLLLIAELGDQVGCCDWGTFVADRR